MDRILNNTAGYHSVLALRASKSIDTTVRAIINGQSGGSGATNNWNTDFHEMRFAPDDTVQTWGGPAVAAGIRCGCPLAADVMTGGWSPTYYSDDASGIFPFLYSWDERAQCSHPHSFVVIYAVSTAGVRHYEPGLFGEYYPPQLRTLRDPGLRPLLYHPRFGCNPEAKCWLSNAGVRGTLATSAVVRGAPRGALLLLRHRARP